MSNAAARKAKQRVRAAEEMASRRMASAGAGTLDTLRDSNLGEMIESLAKGIAEAQLALDVTSIEIAKLMSGQSLRVPSEAYPDDPSQDTVIEGPRVKFGKWSDGSDAEFSLLELGMTPNFYQFVETTLEVKVSISMSADISIQRKEDTKTTEKTTKVGFFKSKTTTKVTSVSSRFSASFQYSVEGSSRVRTRLVPVPPPGQLLEVLREAAAESRAAAQSG